MSDAARPRRLGAAMLAASLLAVLVAVPGATAQWTDASAWIDQPLNGSRFPTVAAVSVTAHATDAAGVASLELYVNGVKTDSASSDGERTVEADFTWTPPGAGGYILVVAGVGTSGQRTASGSAMVFIGWPGEGPGGSPTAGASPTETPSPSASGTASPTATASPTPTPTARPTPTPAPTPTPDISPPHAAISADPTPAYTTSQITLSVVASDTSGIAKIQIWAKYEPSSGGLHFFGMEKECTTMTTCSVVEGPYGGSGGTLSFFARVWDNAGNFVQTPTGTDEVSVKLF